MRRILITASLAVAALVVATAASAALSPAYQVAGFETGVPQGDVSAFAGFAAGSTGDRGFWQASVAHDPLTACSTVGSACAITGGTFSLRTSDGAQLAGTFSAGTIAPASQAAGCGTQQYAVAASAWTNAGPKDFAGTLTHYRILVRGLCRTVAATLRGTVAQSIGSF